MDQMYAVYIFNGNLDHRRLMLSVKKNPFYKHVFLVNNRNCFFVTCWPASVREVRTADELNFIFVVL